MNDSTQEAPSLIGIGAQSIVERAKSLGLTWTIRPATVTVAGITNDAKIVYDGDDSNSAIGCINISGIVLNVNDRVMVVGVPPSANYVIGPLGKSVIADPWHMPTLLNAWVNFDTTIWQGARYRKMADGMVTIQGLVKNGTGPPSDIFILPVGYRPVKNLIFASIANNVVARLDVNSSGSVTWSAGGTNGFVSISVSFFAG